jgi:rare lipoprotein A
VRWGAQFRCLMLAAASGALISCSVVRHEPRPDSAAPTPIPAPTRPPFAPAPGVQMQGVPPPPPDVLLIPDAVPHWEPRSRYGNPRSYDVLGQRYYVSVSSDGYVERGVASWYGPGFHAVRTSIGESYDMYAMTAAHKTLPLPTYVRVTNLENGRTVVVRVNDRGPFVSNRIIDLSYTAAAKLDMLRKGTAMVEVRAIDLTDVVSSPMAPVTVDSKAQPSAGFGSSAPTATAPLPTNAPLPKGAAATAPVAAPSVLPPPPPFEKKPLFMQAGAFAARGNADNLAARLRQRNFGTVSVRSARAKGKTFYRVRIGPIHSVQEFDRVAAALRNAGVRDAQLALD